jgi:uncharacterized membrane protein YsdA (DUF1294 family)
MAFIQSVVFTLAALLHQLPWTVIALYLLVVNVITFWMYRLDKQAAIDRSWRIPEGTLHFSMLIGGTIGALIAQRRFRHKTKKTSFQIVFKSFMLLQLMVIILLLFKDQIFLS